MTDQFETVPRDDEAVLTQESGEVRRELVEQVRIVGQRQIAHLARAFAAIMVVGFIAAIVARRPSIAADPSGHTRANERVEGLVNGRQANVRDFTTYGSEDLLRGRMKRDGMQVGKD